MSVISKLKVWLTADTTEFSGRLRKSGKEITGFEGKFSKMASLVGKATLVGGIAKLAVEAGKVALEFDRINEKVEQLTGVRDFGLAGDARAIADVFEQDINRVITTANAMMRQLGIDGSEAMQLIRDGLAAGLDVNGDFLDQLREYSPFFREAGVSAQGMLSILQTSITDGVYSDKGLDAIKEATLRIREMTPATRAALDGIGLSSDAIVEGLNNGTIKIIDVIKQVSGRLNELPATSSAVGTAIADIFGGPGEDAGLNYLKTLKNINTELGVMQTEAGKAKAALADSLSQLDTNLAKVSSGLAPILTEVKRFFVEFANSYVEILASEDLSSWQKAYSLWKGLRGESKEILQNEKERVKVNQEAIAFLELNKQSLEDLEGTLCLYESMDEASQIYYSRTIAAIQKTIELRRSGVAAIKEESGAGGELLSDEEKARAMEEGTIAKIQEKIKAYKKLLNEVNITDIDQAAAHTREIARLNEQIQKHNELVAARNAVPREGFEPMEQQEPITPPKLEVSDEALTNLNSHIMETRENLQLLGDDAIEIGPIVEGALEDMAVGIGEVIGNAMVSGNLANGLMQAVGGAFADMAIQVGKIAIQTGIVVESIKWGLSNLGGIGMIAAGVALVAVGTAAKAALGKVASGGGSGSISTSGGYQSNSLDLRTASGTERVTQTVNVEVSGEFRLQGNTLVAAVNKETNRKKLTT